MDASTVLARTLEGVRRRTGYRLRTGATVARWLMPRLPDRFECELVPGIRLPLDFRQEGEAGTWWSGTHYEAPTPDRLLEWLAGADRFFDMGANYGFYSYLALSRSNAEVYAFEPNPSLIDRMEATKRANGLGRFHPQCVGISDERAELAFAQMDEQTHWSTFAPLPGVPSSELPTAPVVPFDEWRAEHDIPLPTSPRWVAKLDIEGFETRGLRGMEASLRAHAFLGLVIELNELLLERCGSSAREVRSIMSTHGYRELALPHGATTINAFFTPTDGAPRT